MNSGRRLRIAIQKSGRLSKPSHALLDRCGLEFRADNERLFRFADNMAVDLLLVRDDDVPDLIEKGVCDTGIIGRNVLAERALGLGPDNALRELRPLGFGACRLSVAGPADRIWQDVRQAEGLRIATSHPNLLRDWLLRNGVRADIVALSGSVEIAPRLGTADLVCDVVSTGATLAANGLKEFSCVLESEAVLVGRSEPPTGERGELLRLLLRRLDAVLVAPGLRLLILQAPRRILADLLGLLPEVSAPVVTSIEGEPEDVSVQCLCRDQISWHTLEIMQRAGARGMLVLPVERMLA